MQVPNVWMWAYRQICYFSLGPLISDYGLSDYIEFCLHQLQYVVDNARNSY